jgi:HD-GYP domain-containing protein (c-di-GMP phosphodiesterase class II)
MSMEQTHTASQRNPIIEAQQQLAVALGEARASEDRDLARQVRELGERLARILHGLLRLTQMHAPSNRAFDGPVHDFETVMRELIGMLGPAEMICVENQVYVNDLRLRFDANPDQPAALSRALERFNVDGVTFYEPLTEPQIRDLIGILACEPEPPLRRTALQRRLAQAGLVSVALDPPYQFQMEDEEYDKEYDEVYRASAMVVAETLANMAANRMPNPLPVRRVIHELIDVVYAHFQDAPGIAWETDAELPPFSRHTLMVTNLSLLIGLAARLSASTIADLGMAAMFHDVGIYIDDSEDARVTYGRHTRSGLGMLLRQRGFHAARIRRLLAVLEHHKQYNDPVRPSLFARIIHIADDYDILTRPRPWVGPAYAPPDAMRLMAAQKGIAYDPVLLQLFFNSMGPFPPGSMLRLDDGKVVISASGVRSPETFGKPLCKVALFSDGSFPDEDQMVDLARSGRVVEIVRPRKADPSGHIPPPPERR